LAVVLLILSLVPYTYNTMKFLPDYSVDENDIVESAVAFTAGDLNPYWHKYGGLYAYLLAAVFSYQAMLLDVDVADYTGTVFFRGTSLYYTARYISSLLLVLSGLIAARLANRQFGDRVGRMCLLFAAVPLGAMLTRFTARVDTLQGLWTILAIAAAVGVVRNVGTASSALTGLWWGLSVATKPIPGMMLFPTVLLAHFAGTGGDLRNRESAVDAWWRWLLRTGLETLRRPRLYLCCVAALLAFGVCHPAAVVDFRSFAGEQLAAVLTEGGKDFPPGWDISRFAPMWGWPLTVAMAAAMIGAVFSSIRRRRADFGVVVSYPAVLWLAYATGAANDYFYVPAVPAMLVVLAVWLDESAEIITRGRRWRKEIVTVIGVLVALWYPISAIASDSIELIHHDDYWLDHAGLAGARWIEEHIPSGSTILIYGYYSRLPHLLADRPDDQAQYGEHFMYGRHRNLPYQRLFLDAYRKELESGRPRYRIIYQKQKLEDAARILHDRCVRLDVDFVVSRHDLDAAPRSGFVLAKDFDRSTYPFGWPWKLYRVTRSPGTDAAGSGNPHASRPDAGRR